MPHLQPKIMGLYHKFIPDEAIEGFDRYKYSCKDTNPLSVYVMHPFWNRVVILCPRWVAPNVLTLVGFLCCVTHYLLPAIYDYDFSSPRAVPSAVWIAVGILLFLSHTLDGIDGKQARRTGTSSPLGELFDHGCDSWATVFTTSTLYAVFGNNADGLPPIRMYMLLWCIFTCFHVSHWEKYNTGVMYLPWNYDLSMVSGFTLYIVTGIVGVESLKVRVYGLRLATFFEVVTYCATFLVAIPVSLQNIYLSYRDGTGKMRSFVEAVRPLVPLSSMAVICWSWIQLSPNNVLLADFRCICYLSGTIYSNICCRLIVAQMSDTRSEIFNIFLIPLAAGAAICILVPGLPRAGELAVLYILSLTLTLAHLHYSTCILIQLCDHLNIRCFTIDPKTMMTAMEGNVNIDDRERLLSIQGDLSDPVLAVTAGSAERHPLDN